MPSPTPELRTRVARVATTSAAVAAFVAALLAAFVADRVISGAEEDRLRTQASAILAELAPLPREGATAEAREESEEVFSLGLRIAVYEGADFLAGDRALANRIECATSGGTRTCGVALGNRTCVVAAHELIAGRIATFGIAALSSLLLAALLGAAAGRRAAHWAVAPIVALAERVRNAGTSVPELGDVEGIREVDDLRSALQTTWARLADALAAARRFSADAAHELRTPLTTLSAELEMLEEGHVDPATLPRARGTVAKLAKLTEQLLMLSRSGERLAGGDAVVLKELFQSLASEQVVVTGSEHATIRGDETLMMALAENAVSNALIHGGGVVTVEIAEHGGEVVVDVRDEGPGVPLEERERLFEPFVRGTQRRGGHGIGLALIAHVARAHGGLARFEQADRGAHLRIVLPAWSPREP